MRTFAQKPKATQQTKFAKSTRPSRTFSGQSREVDSILHLQRTIGNQAVQRLLQANSEEREDGSSTSTSPRFAHDFSQIPVHAHTRTNIRPKLKVNTPGDSHEQEADRMAEEVMRIPDREDAGSLEMIQLSENTTVQRLCQECEEERQQGELQRKGARPDAEVDGHVESEVQALRGNGSALPASPRSFFEPRFGHDFAAVRVHTDSRAARLARSVNARAFTLGRDIVFGSWEYSPETEKGKRLLAHELTHVTQQEGAAFPALQCAPDREQQQPSSGPTEREVTRDVFLRRLARWPMEAHEAWKKLSGAEQMIVLLYMGERYGQTFSSEFLRYTKAGSRFEAKHYSSRAELLKGFGERARKVVEFLAPKNLRARGYRLATIDALNEWWLHSSGAQITVALDKGESPEIEERAQAPSETVIEGTEDWPTQLDPNADREDLFGSIIATRENADVAFGRGDVVLYEDGTVELFLEGTTESYVFRPLPGGGYVVYGPDGGRLDLTWTIPEEDIPDPNTDAVE